MKIVVDGMGGDNAPQSNVEGAVNAIKEYGINIVITGDKEILEKEFSKYDFVSFYIWMFLYREIHR